MGKLFYSDYAQTNLKKYRVVSALFIVFDDCETNFIPLYYTALHSYTNCFALAEDIKAYSPVYSFFF